MSPHPPRVDVCIIQGVDAIADDQGISLIVRGITSAGEA